MTDDLKINPEKSGQQTDKDFEVSKLSDSEFDKLKHEQEIKKEPEPEPESEFEIGSEQETKDDPDSELQPETEPETDSLSDLELEKNLLNNQIEISENRISVLHEDIDDSEKELDLITKELNAKLFEISHKSEKFKVLEGNSLTLLFKSSKDKSNFIADSLNELLKNEIHLKNNLIERIKFYRSSFTNPRKDFRRSFVTEFGYL